MVMAALRSQLKAERVVVIIRQDRASATELLDIASSVAEAGLGIVEFPLTNPGALSAIEKVALAGLGLTVGAGTVLTAGSARAVADAGGSFIVTPHLDAGVIEAARACGLDALPGAFSPTEIALARSLDVAAVKVFPAGQLGAGYIRALLAPYPDALLVPTGGVTIDTARDYLDAGAVAIGVGGDLLGDGSREGIKARARELRRSFQSRRDG